MNKVGVTVPCSVVSIDLLDVERIEGVHFIKGDFMEDSMKRKLQSYIDNRLVDVVISDIAPNFSGDHDRDHIRQVIDFMLLICRLKCAIV